MKQLALLARFCRFTNLFICACTVALCLQSAILLDWLFIPGWLYTIVFTNSFFVCGLYDLFINAGNAGARAAFWQRNRRYLIVAVSLAALITGLFSIKLSGTQLMWLAVFNFSTLLSGIVAMVFKKVKSSKPQVIETSLYLLLWAVFTTVIPATFIPFGFDNKFYCILIFRVIFILAVGITFSKSGEHKENPAVTIDTPSIKSSQYWFSYSGLVLASIMLIPAYFTGIPLLFIAALLVSLAVTLAIINYTRKHFVFEYHTVVLNGIIILQTLLICIPALIA